MGLPSFFRPHKHKTFDFRPRYYNENKEELENIIKNAKLEMGMKKGDAFKPSISRGSFRDRKINIKQTNFQSAIRLFLILLILLLLFGYLIFFYKTKS